MRARILVSAALACAAENPHSQPAGSRLRMIVLAPKLRLAEAEVRQALLPIPLIAHARWPTTAPRMPETTSLRRCGYSDAMRAA